MQGYDFIIAGGGSAGCTLAARLSEDPDVRALLLEAGGADKGLLFQIPASFAKMTKGVASWGWSTVPQRNMQGRVLWYTQAKILGGGSAINAQIYTRGNAADYDAWENQHGCQGWNFRTLLPYFRRSEGNQRFVDDYHGIDGPTGVSMPLAPLPIADAFIRRLSNTEFPTTPISTESNSRAWATINSPNAMGRGRRRPVHIFGPMQCERTWKCLPAWRLIASSLKLSCCRCGIAFRCRAGNNSRRT